MRLERVTVIGAGAWGTALAQAAVVAGRRVTLVGRDPAAIAEINETHRNSRHLGDVALDPGLRATERFADADLAVMAVPAQATRATLAALPAGALDGVAVVLSAKGLEATTLRRQSEVLAEAAPAALPFVLSGPSFAADLAAGRPTAVTLAGDDAELTEEVAAALAGPHLRPYAAGDRVGVELAGALKNVYALAAGAVEGAGLGFSARAALIARGFAEMARLVAALGGEAQTLSGLAGLGDLTLSCTTVQSRNYAHGMMLARGQRPDAARKLAEGVFTAPVARMLARAQRVDAPLIDAVNLLLEGTRDIDAIVAGLMARPLKREN